MCGRHRRTSRIMRYIEKRDQYHWMQSIEADGVRRAVADATVGAYHVCVSFEVIESGGRHAEALKT